MARMVPDTAPAPGPGRQAEATLWRALRDELPDDWFAYHGLRYVDGNAREGETDFLLLHRQHGMLVIECKGFGVRRDERGRWIRLRGGREEAMQESPFDQAQRQVHELASLLLPRACKEIPALAARFPFTFGHMAAFPTAEIRQLNLPLDVRREIVLDVTDLGNLSARIPAALSFWRADRRPAPLLAEHEFERFRKHVLHPELHIVPSVGATLRAGARQFLRLSDEQRRALDGALVNPRLLVTGGAGTGKTVLALEAARRLATRGDGARVGLLCFNKHLARHLERCVAAMELPRGQIVATHFHRLCIQSYGRLGRKATVPEDSQSPEAARFWTEEAPLALWEAVDSGVAPRWDALVVDEGQDFAPAWWNVLRDGLADPERSPLLVFADPAQDIFLRGGTLPEFPARYALRWNFRNTRRIADLLRRLGGGGGADSIEVEPHPDAPEGEPVVVHEKESPARTRRQLEEVIRRLLRDGVEPDWIAVLTPHRRENSSLAGVSELAGLRLAEDPLERKGALLHTTFGSFKGLEAEIVLLVDVDPLDPRCNRAARYVAASRARQLLNVWGGREWDS